MTEAVPAFLPRNLRQRRKGSGTNCFRLHRTMKAAIWLRVLMLEQREYRTDAETFAAIDLDAAAGDECRAFTEQPDDRRTDLGFLAQTLERRLTCELRSEGHTSELQSLMSISTA